MKKSKFKGRCTKRSVSKCEGVCVTQSDLASRFSNMLSADESVVKFRTTVELKQEGVGYTSDFLCEYKDGKVKIWECVESSHLIRPSICKLLDISREYWLSKGVEWGLVVDVEE